MPVSESVASAIPTAVNIPASGVRAPASKFTTEREKPPETGEPPLTPEPMFANPIAINSELGSILWRLLAARVWATDTDSTNPTKLIRTAAGTRAAHMPGSMEGKRISGSPPGTCPTRLTPALPKLKCQAAAVVTITADTGAAFATISAPRGARPSPTSAFFRYWRHRNRYRRVPAPIANVIRLKEPNWLIRFAPISIKL